MDEVIQSILTVRRGMSAGRAILVGISGIDASGKGFIATKLAEQLENKGFNVAVINVDGWLNLPHVRFTDQNHGRHFYENALRLDEMFETLVLPLRQNRSINITADLAEETAAEFRKHNYAFSDIDMILLEGIFLFKPSFLEHFDLRVWVDCSFETALSRAIERSQEGMTADETATAYEAIYFPAQRLHFHLDSPREASDLILQNDKKVS